MTASNRRRLVLACQQTLALAVVAAISVPAASLVELDILPGGTGSPEAAPGSAPSAAREVAAVATAPVEPRVTEVPLTADSLRARRAAGRFAVVSTPVAARGYATVGVTWAPGVDLDDDEISLAVRTRDAGVWSEWQDLEYHDDHGPDPGAAEARRAARPGTDALVVGDVDDVQVRAETADGTVPDDLRLAVVDPGTDRATRLAEPALDTADLDEEQGGAVLAGKVLSGPSMVTARPQIFSRSQWGADERLRDKGSLTYGEVHAAFVHHTVNANSYSRDQVPSLIRGIYAYHTQSRGWSDVGYNFLVDRFGRIWEGRYGGVARPVVGAHTLGYNDDAFAMSAIGNFDTAQPSQAVVDAYKRLFAWKLSLHGVAAGSTRQRVSGDWFPAVNGHRDAGSTACPGRYLYAKLSEIRAGAATIQRPFTSRQRYGNTSGNAWPDLVVRRKSDHHIVNVRTDGQVFFLAPRNARTGWRSVPLRALGDVTGDGVADLVARVNGGPVSLHPGNGSGGFGAATRTYSGMSGFDQLTGVGDFDGDGRDDVVGRVAETKALVLYAGLGEGRFKARVTLAARWDHDLTTGVDDLDGDGKADLVVRDGDTLSLVPGTGRGLRAPRALPGSWSGFDVVTGRGDLTGDGEPDLVARARSSKVTWIYPGNGSGGFQPRLGGYTRFGGVDWLAAGGNVVGSRAVDLVGLHGGQDALKVFPNTGRRNVARHVDTGIRIDDLNLLLNVGDWNADGFGDFMYRKKSTNELMLRLGQGADRYAAPVRVATGWGRVVLVAGVGDVTGDGFPDLMGRDGSGAVRIWPSNGRQGFAGSYVAHSSISGDRQVGIGLMTPDGAPDSLIRRTDGSVWLWAGNGPGGLTTGRKVASGASAYSWWKGIGDLDGDKRPDVVARDKAGNLWLMRGTATGLAPRRMVAPGFGIYDFAG